MIQGPVVRRPVSANPWLNFNPLSFSFCVKAFPRIIALFFLEQPSTKLQTKRIKLNLLFNFTQTLGYLNPALKNPAQVPKTRDREYRVVYVTWISSMQLFCRLVPPPTLLMRKNVTFSKTWRRCRHTNLVSTLGVTQCEPTPPPPPWKILAMPLYWYF